MVQPGDNRSTVSGGIPYSQMMAIIGEILMEVLGDHKAKKGKKKETN